MTEEQINIAIAEACGWQWNVQKADGRWWVMYPNGGGAGMTEKITAEYFFSVFSIPDYLNDLNAMHEAEGTLGLPQFAAYASKLVESAKAFYGESGAHYAIHATAAQRAEAFLRTIGKWKEAP